jgi:outer membrane receptor protein involved in Fe transport
LNEVFCVNFYSWSDLVAVATIAAVAATAAAEATASTAAATTSAAAEATAATTAAATKSTPATTRTILARLGFIDGQSAAFVLLSIQGSNRGLGFGIVRHFDESEAFAAAGVTIVDDLSAFDGAVRRKQLFQHRAIY